MKRFRVLAWAVFAYFLVVNTPTVSLAAGPDPSLIVGAPAGAPLSGEALENRTREVASLIRCPTCQGLSIGASPSEAAVAMRGEAKDMLAAGYDEEQVLLYFEASYGEFIRLRPKAEGLNLAVWSAPVAFLLVGGSVIATAMWKRRRGNRQASASVLSTPEHLLPYVEIVRQETSG